MFIRRNIFFVLFFFAFFVLPLSVFAQNAVSEANIVATLNIRNSKILSQEGNQFKIYFEFSNPDKIQPGVKHAVALIDSQNNQIADRKIYEETLSVTPGQDVKKEINYEAPDYLKGKYKIFIQSSSDQGVFFGSAQAGEAVLNGNGEYLELDQKNCYIGIKEGSSVEKVEFRKLSQEELGRSEFAVSCAVASNFKKEVFFSSSIDVYKKSVFGELAASQKTDSSLSLKPGQEKEFIFDITELPQNQTYELRLQMLGQNGEVASNPFFGIFLTGKSLASIQNLRLDKDFYQKGETAKAFFSWFGEAEKNRTVMNISVSDSKGDLCGQKETALSQIDKFVTAAVEIPITINCLNPKVGSEIKDLSGNILAQAKFDVETKSLSDDEINKILHPSLSFKAKIVFAGIILALIALLLWILKRNKNRMAYSVFVFAFVSLGILLSSSANAMVVNVTVPDPTPPGSTVVTVSYDINSSVYLFSPGTSYANAVLNRCAYNGGAIETTCSITAIAGTSMASGNYDYLLFNPGLGPVTSDPISLGYQIYLGDFTFTGANFPEINSGYSVDLAPIEYTAYAPTSFRTFQVLNSSTGAVLNPSGETTINIPYGTEVSIKWEASWSRSSGSFWDDGLDTAYTGEADPDFDYDCMFGGAAFPVNYTNHLGPQFATRTYSLSCKHNNTLGGLDPGVSRTVTLVVLAPPLAPTNLSASAVSSSQINLSWTDNSSNEDGFKIERYNPVTGFFGQIATVGANVTSYPNIGLSAGTEYRYRIRAYNGSGDSAYSNEVSATTYTSATLACSPATASVNVGSTQQFNALYDADGSGPGSASNVNSSASWNSSNSSIATVNSSGLASGVTAGTTNINASYSGLDCSSQITVNLPVPAAPTGVSVSPGGDCNTLNVSWNASAYASEYYVMRSGTLNGTYVYIDSTSGTSYSNSGLSGGTAYYYKIVAHNASGNSPDSAAASGTTGSCLPAAPVLNSATAVSSTQINLAWSASSGAVDYQVMYKPSANSIWLAFGGLTANTFSSVTGLAPSTSYDFFVIAHNTSGYSPASNIRSATTLAGASFTLSASPSTIYAPRTGVSESSVISIVPANGFSSVVDLSVTGGLPAGAVESFSDSSITPAQTSSLSITLPSGTIAGDYFLTIHGQSGSLADDVSITLKVVDLSVDLKAAVNSASGIWADSLSGNPPLNDIDFQATVSGSAQGTINYKLDCTNNGTWEFEVSGSSLNPYEFLDACDYASAGTYTARVMVERSMANPAYDSAVITVTNAPTFSLSVSPSTVKAPKNGTSQNSTITITSQNGFSSQVNLSITSGLPAGASYSIMPMTSATPPANGSITRDFLVTTSNVAAGYYLLNLQGTSGSIIQNAAIALAVVDVSVDLKAAINSASGIWADSLGPSASPLNDVDFQATVSGSAAGTINYKLDCTNNGTWEFEVSGSSINPYEILDRCDYSTALPSQVFTARIYVERDVANPDDDTAQITVTNQPDFSLSASPSTIYAPRTGVSQSAGISINPINGFNSSVALSISSVGNNLPAGASANFSVNPISQGLISSLSFSVVAGTSVGSYTFNLRGTSGSLSHDMPMVLEVVDVSVDLMAAVNSGSGFWFAALEGDAPFNDIDFQATVSGSAAGTINYKFDCDYKGEPPSWDLQVDGSSSNPYEAINLCDYSAPGSYTARVMVERSAAVAAYDSVAITVKDPALPTLSCNLSANPASGTPPLDVAFSADVSGTQTGTMNYSFWPNCNSTCATVSSCTGNCGAPPVPPKLDGTLVDPYNFNYSYNTSGLKYARMIVERGSLSSACAAQINVTNDQAPVAGAKISKDGVNYSDTITVVKGVPANIYLSGSESSDPDGWTHISYGVSNGGRCEWNSNLDRNTAQTFDNRIDQTVYDPASPASCNISLGSKTFNDDPGTYTYDVLRIKDNQLLASNIDTVTVVVEAQTPAPSVDFSANPAVILPGQSTYLSWSTIPAGVSCVASSNPSLAEWSGAVDNPGNETIILNLINPSDIFSTYHFTLTCTSAGGSTMVTRDVIVQRPGYQFPTLVCSPVSAWIEIGQTQQFKAVYYPNGAGGIYTDITTDSGLYWFSDNPSIASIGQHTGLANGLQEGTTGLYADYNGMSGIRNCEVSLIVSNIAPPAPPPPTNHAPTVSGISEIQPDYCEIKNASATLVWNFVDQDGDDQLAYRVQVDNNSDFSSPAKDTGKVISMSDSYYTGSSGLNYNTTYYWRVMVWDEYDAASAWSASRSFATPHHAYPTADFSWAPAAAAPDQQVFFTDASSAASGYSISSRSWIFEDGNPETATKSNPVIKFKTPGSKTVDLAISDGTFTCLISKEVNIQVALPGWKETAPRLQ